MILKKLSEKSNNELKKRYRKLIIENRFQNIKKHIRNNAKKILVISFFIFLIFLIAGLIYFNNYFKGITGFQIVGTKLVILTTVENLCNMTLEQGWNLVSFPCIGEDLSINTFFGDNETFDTLISYVSEDSIDPWKSYNPDLPNWTIQDLNLVSRRKGYWLFINNQTRLIINSSLATPTIINLKKGWNLVGYPSILDRHINETFGQLNPNFDYVYMYNASNNEWKEYTWNSSKPSSQNLNYTILYYGYWVYMLNESSMIITT